MKYHTLTLMSILAVFCLSWTASCAPGSIPQYRVFELVFSGSEITPGDNPVRDVILEANWVHEDGNTCLKIYGFWDGDGRGGPEGNVYKVRFCPIKTGSWTLESVNSNDPVLNGQHAGLTLQCIRSDHPGFWVRDPESAGGRWYERSNGTHPYIVGNTLYSYVSEYYLDAPNGSNIEKDTRLCGKYYNKIRFAVTGDIYPHPTGKPFLDDSGTPTDDGNYSHRPNPSWFHGRVDLAVQTCNELDVIADLILNGPDSPDARAALRPGKNDGDPAPYLRYIAARYGSYPNVWICLSNEFEIRDPRYEPSEIRKFGHTIRKYLPYNVPLSVHPRQVDWYAELNDPSDPWNDHVIFQNKIKQIHIAADKIALNYWIGGGNLPVINDELAYEGEGDGWGEDDVLEAFTGALLGGGYGSTGYKSGHKLGHYFAGNFSAEEHTASDNLLLFRELVDKHVNFWEMAPFTVFFSRKNGIWLDIFQHVEYDYRLLSNGKEEYLLGASGPKSGLVAHLPEGSWEVRFLDVVNKKHSLLEKGVSGEYVFDLPDSRAILMHFKRID